MTPDNHRGKLLRRQAKLGGGRHRKFPKGFDVLPQASADEIRAVFSPFGKLARVIDRVIKILAVLASHTQDKFARIDKKLSRSGKKSRAFVSRLDVARRQIVVGD